MPKETFFSLPDEKRMRVYQACKQEFEQHPFHEAKVMHIVKALGIPSGSFYQYFDGLLECYFYILSKETNELHGAFIDLIKVYPFEEAIDRYKYLLLEQLIHSDQYALYRYRFLSWDYRLDQAWAVRFGGTYHSEQKENPVIQVFKAVVHDLVFRLYAKAWGDQAFIAHYGREHSVVLNGVKHEMMGHPHEKRIKE